jgi:hypothetical protein
VSESEDVERLMDARGRRVVDDNGTCPGYWIAAGIPKVGARRAIEEAMRRDLGSARGATATTTVTATPPFQHEVARDSLTFSPSRTPRRTCAKTAGSGSRPR